jgi:hypothetical protein
LKPILALIKYRTAPVHFCWITRENVAKDGHLTKAIEMARAACDLPRSHDLIEIEPHSEPPAGNVLEVQKVTADIPNNAGSTEEAPKKPVRSSFALPYRGRDKLAAMRNANCKRIMEAPSRDSKPAPISVTAEELTDVFEKRLNTPAVLPPQFDSAQHKINLAMLLPEKTEDSTPGFFTQAWSEDDMSRLKDHIRKHSLDSTPGEDTASYVDGKPVC